MATQKSESIAGKLLSKLGKSSSDKVFDVAGNEIGSISNGKVVIDGVSSKKTVLFDDEPETTAL